MVSRVIVVGAVPKGSKMFSRAVSNRCVGDGVAAAGAGDGGARSRSYIAAMRAARRLANGVAGSTAGVVCSFLVERGNVQSHSSAPI